MNHALKGRRVTFVVPHSPSAVGYTDIDEFLRYAAYHRRFCECVMDRGASVEFVILSQNPATPQPNYEFPVRAFPVTAGESFGRELSPRLVKYLWKTDADVIHLHGYNQPNIFQLVPPLIRFDGMTVAHNHGSPLALETIHHRLWYRVFVRVVAPSLACVLSVNRQELENLISFGLSPEKTGYLPNAVDHKLFEPAEQVACRDRLGLDDDRRYLLFVGRITEHKGIPYLVSALSNLPADVTLLLVYSGVDKETIADVERIISAKELENQIQFVGAVDRSTLPDYYNAADVCVFPSVTEGFGIVVLEAMACGRPVVGTTEHAAAGHLIHEQTGMVAETHSTDSIVENVTALLSDDNLASHVGQNGRERVLQKYTWDQLCDRLAEVYI